MDLFVCNITVNNFSVISGWRHRLLGFNKYTGELMCLAQGHNTVLPVRIKSRIMYRVLVVCLGGITTKLRKIKSYKKGKIDDKIVN